MSDTEAGQAQNWKTVQVYTMAVVCLVIGLVLGYLFRGSETAKSPDARAAGASTTAPSSSAPAAHMPTLEDMKHMADTKAEPLLAKLKTDPKNPELLNQLGTIYKSTHQFPQAAEYYQKAIDADPKNVPARTDLASCLFYQGDADGAIQQLQQALAIDPKDANSLFNLGIIRLQGKNDSSGAVDAWRKLLKLNPALPQEKKDTVEKLIADAQQQKMSK